MLANVEKRQIDKHHVMDVGAIKLDVGESIAGTAVTDGADSPHWQLFAPPSLIKLPVKRIQQAQTPCPCGSLTACSTETQTSAKYVGNMLCFLEHGCQCRFVLAIRMWNRHGG